MRYNKKLKDKLNENNTYPFMRYLHGTPINMVDATMCAKVAHPPLAWGVGSSKKVPKLNQWKCAGETCDICGVKNLRLGECKDLSENDDEVEILEWIEAERQGKKRWNAKYST